MRQVPIVLGISMALAVMAVGCVQPTGVTTQATKKTTATTSVIPNFSPSNKPDYARGKKIYQKNCVSCHGEAGDGKGPSAGGFDPPPADFTDKPFMDRHAPSIFWESITKGLRKMPSFKSTLTDQERWDVLYYARFFATSPEKVASGKKIYVENCQVCHGTAGDGKGTGATGLTPPPADFTDLRFMNTRSDKSFAKSIEDGKSAMPSFKQLSQQEREAVLDFERTFSYTGAPTK